MKPSESLHHLNAQDIAYEESPQESLFNVSSDILPEEIERVHDLILKVRKSRLWWEYVPLANLLDGLDPRFEFTRDAEVPNADIWDIRNRIRRLHKNIDESDCLQLATLARTYRELHPSDNLPQEITAVEIGVMRSRLQSLREHGSWSLFARLASNLHYLDPTFHLDQEITETDRQGMRASYQASRKSRKGWEFEMMAASLFDISKAMNSLTPDATPRPLPEVKHY